MFDPFLFGAVESRPNFDESLSSVDELEKIANLIKTYASIPLLGLSGIPPKLLERILANVKNGFAPDAYDFADVVTDRCGWQSKLSFADTPITLKRVKIDGSTAMIEQSLGDPKLVQDLGDTVIGTYNEFLQKSFVKYSLTKMGYSRLIIFKNGTARYFERILCDAETPILFDPKDFTWSWSEQRKSNKECLSALHGFHRDGSRWFAWHGRGENQLHFTGEKNWWPSISDPNQIEFRLAAELSLDDFILRMSKS